MQQGQMQELQMAKGKKNLQKQQGLMELQKWRREWN
jgi:hypothetical protein